jgi:hypothetical protein
MSFFVPEPVISGKSYLVMQVGGRAPVSLADFAVDGDFTIDKDDKPYRVSGSGVERGGAVRFYEKDMSRDGKDVRVWQISPGSDGRFMAEHIAAF